MEKYISAVKTLKDSYNEFYNISPNSPSFTLYEGSIEGVVFSCPHAVKQIRKGKEKVADINTGPLGKALNQLGYTTLIKTNTFNDDANYDKTSKYKEFLSKHIKQTKTKFLIDLHGMSSKRNISLCLGTGFGKNYNHKNSLTPHFLNYANANGLDCETISIDFPFFASERTVSRFINKTNKIQTLQIEINSALFNDDDKILSLLKCLDEFCKKILLINSFTPESTTKKELALCDEQFSFAKPTNPAFTFTNTGSNVLISAPHACSMIKEGLECYKETYSGVLAKKLGDYLNISTYIKTNKTEYNSQKEYVEGVCEAVKHNNFSCLLEFHIMNEKRAQDLSICCNEGASLGDKQNVVYYVVNTLLKHGLTNFLIDYPFNPKNFNSTINQIHTSTNIPAFKIVINHKIFNSNKTTNKLYTALQEIVFHLNNRK